MTSGIGMQGRSMRKKKTKKWRKNATAMPMPMGIPVSIVSEPEQHGAAGGSEEPLQNQPPVFLPPQVDIAPPLPTGPSAFGPPLWRLSKSPLLLPPRDLFEDESCRAELGIPRGREVLSAVYGYGGSSRGSGTEGLGGTGRESVRGGETTRSKSMGLFGRAGGGLLPTLTGTRGRKECEHEREWEREQEQEREMEERTRRHLVCNWFCSQLPWIMHKENRQ
ncbi:hypothetical protein EV360DRAFT_74674 [Lentinula raphanica]|nr:hypothetical protein EV360DRAFT_74674 [Lentinula raphanica]